MENYQALIEKAHKLKEAGSLNDARYLYEMAIAKEANDYQAWYGLAQALTENFTTVNPPKDYIIAIANALKFSTGDTQTMIQSQYKAYIKKLNDYEETLAKKQVVNAQENQQAWAVALKKMRWRIWLAYFVMVVFLAGLWLLLWPVKPALSLVLMLASVSVLAGLFIYRRLAKGDKAKIKAKNHDILAIKTGLIFKAFIIPAVLFFLITIPLFNSDIPHVDFRYDPVLSTEFIIDTQGNEVVIIRYIGNEESVVVPKEVTRIQTHSFKGALNFKHLSFEEGSQLRTIDAGAFKDTSNLESVHLPKSLQHLGAEAFSNSNDLTTVTFEADSSLTILEANLFLDATALETITIPSSITEIGIGAFHNTTALHTVVFEANTQLARIESEAFLNSGIESLVVPRHVYHIGSFAFSGTTHLEEITFLRATDASDYSHNMLLNTNPDIIVYVPDDAYEFYYFELFGHETFQFIRLSD